MSSEFVQVRRDDLRAALAWVESDAWDENADVLNRLTEATESEAE